jgi:hypothetical protein
LDLAYNGVLTLVSADADYSSEITTDIPLEKRRYGSLVIVSAALAIATDECQILGGQACGRLRSLSAFRVKDSESGDLRPLEVVWGLQPALCESNARDYDLTPWKDRLRKICADLFSTWYGRAIELLWQDVAFPKSYRMYDPVQVPYHTFLSAEQVLDGNMHKRLAGLLTGRIVIYGAGDRSASDHALSPIHGNIDGAFAHAMAIDNLLTFGDQYMHPTSIEGVFDKAATDYQPTALMLVAAVAVARKRRSLIRLNSPDLQK